MWPTILVSDVTQAFRQIVQLQGIKFRKTNNVTKYRSYAISRTCRNLHKMLGWTWTPQGDDMAAEPCPRVGKCSIFCSRSQYQSHLLRRMTHSTRGTYRKPCPLFIIFLLLVHCGDKPNELQRIWWHRSAIFPGLPAGSQSVNNRESRTRLITNNRHRHWTRREAM